MVPIKAAAVVLLASAWWMPLAAAPDDPSATDSMIIQVDVPARTIEPAPTSTLVPPDATPPRSGALPATGAEVALWAGALSAAALVTGLVVRARRRRA